MTFNRRRRAWIPAASWILYDLANTVYAATVVYLFVPVITNNGNGSMTAVGFAQTGSMVFAGLLVPVLGAICDRTGRTRSYLVVSTLVCIACMAGFSSAGTVPLAATLACFFLANLGYQTALVFYNALLPSVARFEDTGRVSGLGTGIGYVGTLLALAVIATISDPQARFFVPAALFLVAAAPCMLWVKERRVPYTGDPDLPTIVDAFRGLGRTVRSLPEHRPLLLFFLGNFLIVDVLNTALLFFGAATLNLFQEQYASGDLELLGIAFTPGSRLNLSAFLVLVGAALNLLALPFGIGFGLWSDRQDSLRVFRVAGWCLAAALVGGGVFGGTSALGYMLTLVLFGAMGLAGIWAVGRKVLLSLAPREKVGEYFGLYGVTMKLSVVGALTFALVVEHLGMKAALLAQLVPLGFGLFLVHAIRRPEVKQAVSCPLEPTPPDGRASSTVPSLNVICEGDPFEMGVSQGTTLQSRIEGTLDSLRELEAFLLEKPAGCPFGLFRWLAERKACRVWSALHRDYPQMTRRLEGIAEGSKLGRGSMWLLNALEPLMGTVEGKTVFPPPGACSAVAIRRRRSSTGEPVVARNFDYLPLLQPFYTIRESRPRGGYRSIDFTMAPLVGAVDGMNECGLCLCYDYAFVRDRPTHSGTISMAISTVLERCRTVAEAAELLRVLPRWGGGMLMLADSTGDIASMELSNTRSALRRPAPGRDVLFHSNRFQTREMRDVEVGPDAAFSEKAPTPLRGRRVHASSDDRDRRLADLLRGEAAFDEDDLQAVLADHGPFHQGGDNTICVHGSYWYTTASLQFFPGSRRVRVAYDTTCNATYEDIAI